MEDSWESGAGEESGRAGNWVPGCKEDSQVEMQRLCLKHTENEDLFRKGSRAWGAEMELEFQLTTY